MLSSKPLLFSGGVKPIQFAFFFFFSYANSFVSVSAEWCKNLKWTFVKGRSVDAGAKQRRMKRGFSFPSCTISRK